MSQWFSKSILFFHRVLARLGGRNIALLLISLFVSVAIIIFTDYSINKIKEANTHSAAIEKSLLEMQRLETYLFQAESAQRGYLLTQKEIYLEPFKSAVFEVKKNFGLISKELPYLSKGEKLNQLENTLSLLSQKIESKTSEMELTLKFAEIGKFKEAKMVVNLDTGIDDSRKISTYIRNVLEFQNNKLDTINIARNNSLLQARIAVIFGSLMLICLVVFVIMQLLQDLTERSRLQQKLTEDNEHYEKRSKEQNKLLRSIALDYQSDAERERQKLARDLHDELGSILTAAKMDITWTIKKIENGFPEIAEKLRKTNRYLDQGIGFKRQVVQDLHPSMITTFGFWAALKTLVEDVAVRNKWQLNLETPETPPVLSDTIGMVAYRIVQETLNNASKYAKATLVSVHMVTDEKHLKIEIEDNGIGVDLNSLDNSTHGLSGMHHRVLGIGGRFEVTSSPGKGMLTQVLIPLDIHKYDY